MNMQWSRPENPHPQDKKNSFLDGSGSQTNFGWNATEHQECQEISSFYLLCLFFFYYFLAYVLVGFSGFRP